MARHSHSRAVNELVLRVVRDAAAEGRRITMTLVDQRFCIEQREAVSASASATANAQELQESLASLATLFVGIIRIQYKRSVDQAGLPILTYRRKRYTLPKAIAPVPSYLANPPTATSARAGRRQPNTTRHTLRHTLRGEETSEHTHPD